MSSRKPGFSSLLPCFLTYVVTWSLTYIFQFFFFLAPRVTPRAFQGFNSSSTSILLSWDPIPQEQVAGILRNFHMTYRPLGTADNTTYNITLPISELTLEITNLQKYTNYSFDIKGATKFIGAATEPIIITTDEDGTSRLCLLLNWYHITGDFTDNQSFSREEPMQ